MPDKTTSLRLTYSYVTTVISITFVLFLLGLVGLLTINAKKISDYVKENINISIILKDNVKEADIIYIQKKLDASPYVKSTIFVSKDKAAEELKKELGEDFVSFLGYNPLLSSIKANLYAEYANNDSIAKIEKEFSKYPQVKEIYYQKNLVHLLNENIKSINFILLIFTILMFLISLTLINNTIRLSVYSKRFILYTMQLIGATRGFIRKPFIVSALIQGFISASLAGIMIMVLVYYLKKEFPQITFFYDFYTIMFILVSLYVIGIVITVVSTYFALNRQLKSKLDRLYYG
jgi:cell division transport system permease protein